MSDKAGNSDSDGKPQPSNLPINPNQPFADSDDDISPANSIPQKPIQPLAAATPKSKATYSNSDEDKPSIKRPHRKPPKPEPPSDSDSSSDNNQHKKTTKKKPLSRKRSSSATARRTPRASKGGASDSNEDDVLPIKTAAATVTVTEKGFYDDDDDEPEVIPKPVVTKTLTKRKSLQKVKDDDSY